MKKAFIRADASVQIGTGHVMRCLTLAGDLACEGWQVFFVIRDLPGNLAALIQKNGYGINVLPAVELAAGENQFEALGRRWREDAEETGWFMLQQQTEADFCRLIVDHYALDAQWEQSLRSVTDEIMVIDDLANRYHDCDILLDQNYYRDMQGRYQGLVPQQCRLLLGPRYALLRSEFRRVKEHLQQRDGVLRRLLVFFGGSDPTQETLKTLRAIGLLECRGMSVDVVVGLSNPGRKEIEQLCAPMAGVHFHCQVDNMAELIARADLAIGAGGTATWERCYLGLPALLVAVAENQVEMVQDLAETGAIEYLGWHEEVSAERLAQAVAELCEEPERLVAMGRRGLELFE